MTRCAVFSCDNKRAEHCFPMDEVMRRKWITATRVNKLKKIGWKLTKYAAVCSEHFTANDYEIKGKKILFRKTAVPSIFPWSPQPEPSYKIKLKLQDPRITPSMATKTYSRSELPLHFVEEYPNLCITDIDEKSEDPLLSSTNLIDSDITPKSTLSYEFPLRSSVDIDITPESKHSYDIEQVSRATSQDTRYFKLLFC